MIKLICENCGSSFNAIRSVDHGRKRRFCTWGCAMKSDWNTIDKRGDKNVSKRPEVKEKMKKIDRTYLKGSSNINWKGDFVGYYALHCWIKSNFGKPVVCEFCGKTKGRLHWANKSGDYTRNKSDWIQLCPTCHYAYDKGMGFRKGNSIKKVIFG